MTSLRFSTVVKVEDSYMNLFSFFVIKTIDTFSSNTTRQIFYIFKVTTLGKFGKTKEKEGLRHSVSDHRLLLLLDLNTLLKDKCIRSILEFRNPLSLRTVCKVLVHIHLFHSIFRSKDLR